MPTAKPRITITLEPHAYEILRRLSLAGGDSMSSLVADFLEVALPPMERMVVILEQAKAVPAEAKTQLKDSLQRAEAKLLPAVMAFADQNDMFLDQVLADAKAAGAGAAPQRTERAVSRLATPVPVTRGSGQTNVTNSGRKAGRSRDRV